MIIRPNPNTFGIEGAIEIKEKNIIEIHRLFKDGVINEKIFAKMINLASGKKSD